MARSVSSLTQYVSFLDVTLIVLTALQSEGQKKEFDTVTFGEGEVWGIDILVSSGEDGKVSILCIFVLLCLCSRQK